MKASKELIEWLEKLTVDNQGFPRTNEEVIGMQVGTLRGLIAILNFENKHFNRVKETVGLVESQG